MSLSIKDVICPRTTIQYQVKSTSSISWRFVSFYPRVSLKYSRFLYYFCLCKSFKELFNAFRPWLLSRLGKPSELVFLSLLKKFLLPHSKHRFLFSGCKGTTFPQTSKTFPKKISFFGRLFRRSWCKSNHSIGYTLLYNYRQTLP